MRGVKCSCPGVLGSFSQAVLIVMIESVGNYLYSQMGKYATDDFVTHIRCGVHVPSSSRVVNVPASDSTHMLFVQQEFLDDKGSTTQHVVRLSLHFLSSAKVYLPTFFVFSPDSSSPPFVSSPDSSSPVLVLPCAIVSTQEYVFSCWGLRNIWMFIFRPCWNIFARFSSWATI